MRAVTLTMIPASDLPAFDIPVLDVSFVRDRKDLDVVDHFLRDADVVVIASHNLLEKRGSFWLGFAIRLAAVTLVYGTTTPFAFLAFRTADYLNSALRDLGHAFEATDLVEQAARIAVTRTKWLEHVGH